VQLERVVELEFAGSSGSGYLITPRHVLTARHVAKPPEKGTQCKVQPLCCVGDAELPLTKRVRPASISGTVVWVPKDESIDLAIIELNDQTEIVGLSSQVIPFGRVPSQAVPWPCRGIGFPAAAGDDDWTIYGTLSWVTRSHRFKIEVETAPTNWQQWAGCSGTSVFCGDLLVGVIWTADSGWKGSVLEATPTEILLDDPEFRAFLTNSRVALPAERKIGGPPEDHFASDVLDRICEIDRGPQVDIVTHEIKSTPGVLIFTLLGVDEDEHHLLMARLSRESVVGNYLGIDAPGSDVLVNLHWPEEPTINPDDAFRDMVNILWARLRLPPPPADQEIDLTALSRQLDSGTTPRGFWVMIDREQACDGHSQLLSRWLQLWTDLGSLGSKQPALLFVCLSLAAPKVRKRSFAQVLGLAPPSPMPDPNLTVVLKEAREKKTLMALPELDKIKVKDVHSWITKLRCIPELSVQAHLESLRFDLVQKIGSGKRLRFVSIQVNQITKRIISIKAGK
jgi:hypothetical protein